MIGQVSGLFANAGRGQVDQQLSEIELGIDIMAAAGAGQAGEDCRRSSSARVPTKREFWRLRTTRFISRSETLLSMGTVPSSQKTFSSFHWSSALDRLRHGVPGQQLFLPGKHSQVELAQQRCRLLLAYLATLNLRSRVSEASLLFRTDSAVGPRQRSRAGTRHLFYL
jgi:hypothetical protein